MDTGLVIVSTGMFLGIVSQNAIGFGASYFVLPILPFFFEISFFVPILLMLYTVNTFLFALREWKRVDRQIYLYIAPSALVGILIGTKILVSLDEDHLKKILGVIIVFLGFYLILSDRIQSAKKISLAWGIPLGFISGIFSNISVANPPLVVFLKLRKAKKESFYATLGTFFLFVNTAALSSFALNGFLSMEQVFIAFKLLPVLLLGSFLGKKLNKKIPEKLFQNIVSTFLVLSGFLLIILS